MMYQGTISLLAALLLFFSLQPLALALADEGDADPYETGLRGTPELRRQLHIAHGIVASLAAAVLFPLGAILLRSVKSSRATRIHWMLQMVSLFTLLAGFILGVWLAYLHDQVGESQLFSRCQN
jgi:uncharacterized oligopeptide transporter (OPT) family protein